MTKEYEGRILKIETSLIVSNKYQPRLDFNNDKLEELSKSIEENGLLQPIILRPEGEGYEIISGERRFRAVELLGLGEIPSIVVDVENRESAKLALIENIQREDLNLVEEARAYSRILEEFDITQEELATSIGRSRPYVSNTIRLLDLDDIVLEYLISGDLTSGHGKLLLGVKDKSLQIKVAKEIVEKKLTVRSSKALIDRVLNKKPRQELHKDFYLKSLEEDLMMHFGTRVNLVRKKQKGVIEIEFYNEDDLGRILDILS